MGCRREIRIAKGRAGGGIAFQRLTGEHVAISLVGGIIRPAIGCGEPAWHGCIRMLASPFCMIASMRAFHISGVPILCAVLERTRPATRSGRAAYRPCAIQPTHRKTADNGLVGSKACREARSDPAPATRSYKVSCRYRKGRGRACHKRGVETSVTEPRATLFQMRKSVPSELMNTRTGLSLPFQRKS